MELSEPPEHLQHDPYDVFRASTTPAGLYARQKWLGEVSTSGWQADFAATVAELYRGQSAQGLWRGSVIETIQRLFGLHLTVRNPEPRIDGALDALVKIASGMEPEQGADWVGSGRLTGLPFREGPRAALIVPAVLFLCAIFGRSGAAEVLALYDRAAGVIAAGSVDHKMAALYHNLLRALVVHPRYADHAATRRLVGWLGDRQSAQGEWGSGIPFYQALNALAHLDTPAANAQTRRALTHLRAIQNADGSWGASDRQWCTFLAVHALRNKGLL